MVGITGSSRNKRAYPVFGSKLTYEYPIHERGGHVRIFMRRKRWQADLNPGLHDMQGARTAKLRVCKAASPWHLWLCDLHLRENYNSNIGGLQF